MYIRETHIGNNGTIALDDIRAVVALQHHIQVHQDPLVLVLVSCTAHLLVTHTHTKIIHLRFLLASECIKHASLFCECKEKQGIRKSQNRDSSGELTDCTIVKQPGRL